ncbi:hypothetical protein [Psychrobacter glacincola]|uniref:hypothetical protein n=1 Tax=Psychrobacter glacincola TaxID=56810 RepID=UPI0039B00E49
MTIEQQQMKKSSMYQNWLSVGLVAAALTLSACGKNDEPAAETPAAVDAQTAVEDEATGVATANSTDDVAVATADNDTAVDGTDDVAVATAE